MKLRNLWNYFVRSYSYFHREMQCKGCPEIYNLELTNRCPMNCRMCPRKLMKRPLGDMDFELYKKIIDHAKKHSEIIILHHFGESLLHPELEKFIKYAKSNGIKTKISTNPVMLYPKAIDAILNSQLDYLVLSLDGATPKTYRFFRGQNADYSKAVNMIKNLINEKKKRKLKKPFIEMEIIRMKETENEISLFKKQWSIPGIDKITIKQFKTFDGSSKEILDMAQESHLTEEYMHPTKYPCIRNWFVLTVLWDGKAVPCCYDYDGKYIIGDLKTQPLEQLWNSERMKALRKEGLTGSYKNPLCRNCREKVGAPKSKLYPLNPLPLRRLGLKRILSALKRKEYEK